MADPCSIAIAASHAAASAVPEQPVAEHGPAPQPDQEGGEEAAADEQQAAEQQQTVNLNRGPKKEAISLLQRQGVSAAQATEAVEGTDDVYVRTDGYTWAEAAQVWLADQLEHAAERGRLAEAMAASLTEAESLKAAAGPWQQQPEAELRRRFAASALLAMFDTTALGGALFQPPVREPLISLLELERKCTCQWYPGSGTKLCFQQIGQQMAGAAPAAAAADGSDPAAAGVDRRQPCRSAKRKRAPTFKAAEAAMKRAAAAGGAGPPTAACSASATPERPASPGDLPARPPVDPVAAAAWAEVLAAKVRDLQKDLAWLPQSPTELPPFLAPYAAVAAADDSGGSDDDCIVQS